MRTMLILLLALVAAGSLLTGCTTERSAVDSYNQRIDDCRGAGNTPFDCKDWIRQ